MLISKVFLIVACTMIFTSKLVEPRRRRKQKVAVGQFLRERYERYLKMNHCKMDIKYSTRYNSYFWNRIQVPDKLDMDIFVLPACKVNGVQMNNCNLNILKFEKFRVDIRKLSERLAHHSILQDIRGLISEHLLNHTRATGGNVPSIQKWFRGSAFGIIANHCFEHYKRKGLGDALEEKYRKNVNVLHCIRPTD